MPFTGRLGVVGQSYPGNIELGKFDPGAPPPPPPPPPPSTPVVNLSAQLTFSGAIPSVIQNHLLFSGAATVIVQKRVQAKAQQRPSFILQIRGIPLKVVQRTTTQLDSQPFEIDTAVTEVYPYQVDVTQYLAPGDSISAIIAVLTLNSTGQIVTSNWQGTISTNANIIQVPIIGSALRLGQGYQLALTFTANTNKILTVLSAINIVA